MAATPGNQFWKVRTKHGRDKLFASPEILWDACCEYFQWVEENPLWSLKVVQYQGAPVDLPEPKMRAMTISGMCLFLGIDHTTWRAWRTDKDFSTIVSEAESVIYNQKLSGAAADLLNANIIARELGLSDKRETEHSGSIQLEQMADDELDRKLEGLIQK